MDVSSRLTHPNQCTYLLSIQYTFNLKPIETQISFDATFLFLGTGPMSFFTAPSVVDLEDEMKTESLVLHDLQFDFC